MDSVMMHGIYSHDIGNDERLYYKGALLLPHPGDESKLLAQFDALHLPEAHGWHEFPAKYFVNVRKLDGAKDRSGKVRC